MIDCCDLVILATPPGFRPQHIEAAIKAGKNLFTEKPVGVDGTGIRKVLAAYEEAKKKKLAVVAGTQRRHQAGYLESMKRIHDGAIGDIIAGRVYWNQGAIWANKRQARAGATPSTSSATGTTSSGSAATTSSSSTCTTSTSPAGRSAPTRSAPSAWAAARCISEPERGQSYDHFAVDYEFPNGVHVMSMCRQIEGCENNVSETIVGTKGQFQQRRLPVHRRVEGARPRPGGINPYVQEHIDLLESIVSGKPINELKQVAESTLTAIMGRMSAYTGKAVTWDQALNSKLDTFPKHAGYRGPDGRAAGPQAGRDRADLSSSRRDPDGGGHATATRRIQIPERDPARCRLRPGTDLHPCYFASASASTSSHLNRVDSS